MRRSVLNIAAAFVVVAAGLPLMGSVASAQEPTVPGCDGDLVSASIEADSLPGGAWKVDGACVPKESYFTGVYKDAYPFAIGVAEVPYADGHTGRLALLEVQLRADLTIALVGMEDQATSALKFAGTLQGATVEGTTAGAYGRGSLASAVRGCRRQPGAGRHGQPLPGRHHHDAPARDRDHVAGAHHARTDDDRGAHDHRRSHIDDRVHDDSSRLVDHRSDDHDSLSR